MRNKPLTLGAALLMAGGNAYAAVCPTTAPVMTIESSGFSCTLGDKVFNSFFFDGVPTTATVSFGMKGPDFAVTLARDGTSFTEPSLLFEYTVAIAAPVTIVRGTLVVDVSAPTVDTRTEMEGNNSLGGLRVMNGGTDMVTFSSGNNSIEVLNSSIPGPNSELSSITNDFLQSTAGAAVPEPMSLSLFGVGLAGLALARRRRA